MVELYDFEEVLIEVEVKIELIEAGYGIELIDVEEIIRKNAEWYKTVKNNFNCVRYKSIHSTLESEAFENCQDKDVIKHEEATECSVKFTSKSFAGENEENLHVKSLQVKSNKDDCAATNVSISPQFKFKVAPLKKLKRKIKSSNSDENILMVKHERKSLYRKKKLEGNKADNHDEMIIKNTVAERIELSKPFKRDLANTIEEKVMVIENQEWYSHPFSIPNGVDKSDKGLSKIDRRESVTCSVAKPVLFPAERNKVKLNDGNGAENRHKSGNYNKINNVNNVNDGIKNACDNEFYDFKNSQVAPVCQANYAYKVKVKFKEKELLVKVIKPVVALYCSGNMKNKSVATISHASIKASFVYSSYSEKFEQCLAQKFFCLFFRF
uniref:Uncharacterized protein n=1 Tax=Panagrolaimus sp. PS1159 TaxID=55785 RepID=A0AC35F9R8_9BILA